MYKPSDVEVVQLALEAMLSDERQELKRVTEIHNECVRLGDPGGAANYKLLAEAAEKFIARIKSELSLTRK